jgi:superfamily II DNA/RNA helicase
MYSVYDTQKEELTRHILSQKGRDAVIIFASTKDKVKALHKVLRKQFDIEAFHSDLEQIERENIMSAFKNKAVKVLIGTDIISRGIDVVGIELVINYDTPGDPEDYVHRVGRTARADKKGEAITFVNPKDQPKFARIEQLIGMKITQNPLPEGFESGPEYKGDAPKHGSGESKFKPKKTNSSKKKKPFNKGPRSDGPSQENTERAPAQPTTQNKLAPAPASASSESTQTSSKYGQRKNVID